MPSIASIFRPKIIRRVLLTMLLAAPIVYLFGTQIGALAGAHGEEVLAETPYQEEWIETNDFQTGEDFKFVFDEDIETRLNNFTGGKYYFNFNIDNKASDRNYIYIEVQVASGGNRLTYSPSDNGVGGSAVYVPIASPQWISYPTWGTIYFSLTSLPNVNFLTLGTLYYKNPVQNTNYRDSLFNNMFGQSNFLTEWGTSVLEDTAVGFEPVNALLQYVGGDMLHLGDTQIGLMALGYSTYVFNVLIVYMLVSLCASLICLPLKVTDIFNRGENL